MGAALVAGALAGCGGGATIGATTVPAQPPRHSVILRGAGSATDFPIYEELGNQLSPAGITLNYQVAGSDQTMAQFRAQRLAFIAQSGSHALLNLPATSSTGALFVPIGFSAVAVVYHLPPAIARLRLTGPTLARIYLGRIRAWNAAPIARENPGLRLPNLAITVIHRQDPDPTTTQMTSYLAAASPRWRRSVHSGAAVIWPAGSGEAGDSGVESAVQRTPGAIGYVSQRTALQDRLSAVALANSAGRFILPRLSATTAVGEGPHSPDNLSTSTIDARSRSAYPIASENYVLVYRDLCQAGLDPGQAAATERFLQYALGAGQASLPPLSIAPLPVSLRAQARRAVSRLQCQSQPAA